MAFLTTTMSFETEAFSPENFDVQPSVDPEGSLSFEPAIGFYGNSTVRFRIKMGNGAASSWRKFSIEVEYVNHAPSFSLPPLLDLAEDSGPQSLPRFAFNISKGFFPEATELDAHYSPSIFRESEAWQTLTFIVEIVKGSESLFDEMPSLSPNGTLTFVLAAHENGNVSFAVQLKDSGGGLEEHRDTSTIINFTIAVSPVNDAPSFNMTPEYAVVETTTDTKFIAADFAVLGIWNR